MTLHDTTYNIFVNFYSSNRFAQRVLSWIVEILHKIFFTHSQTVQLALQSQDVIF